MPDMTKANDVPVTDRNAMAEAFERAEREVAELSRNLDVTNADHIALWLEAHIGDEVEHLGWLACRIVEAHEAVIARLATQPDAQSDGVALAEAVLNLCPVGSDTAPRDRVQAFYIRQDELRALRELAESTLRNQTKGSTDE